MKKPIMIMLILIVSACADTARIKTDPAYESVALDKQHRVYISIPSNGIYGSINYSGSGQTVSTLIRAAALKHLVHVDMAMDVQSYKEALGTAKEKNYDYLVFPTILHWEDRATEWSAISDKVQIKILVVDVNRNKILSSAIIDGKSGLATFGGDHPQDLLPGPIGEYIDTFF
jgi:hypothetical protein